MKIKIEVGTCSYIRDRECLSPIHILIVRHIADGLGVDQGDLFIREVVDTAQLTRVDEMVDAVAIIHSRLSSVVGCIE